MDSARVQPLVVFSVVLMAAVAACTSTGNKGTPEAEPSVSQSATGDGPAVEEEPPKPVTPPPRPTRVDVGDVGVTRLPGASDLGTLPVGEPTPVPWTDFLGNPENGKPQSLHSGDHAMPLTSEGYLREAAVWATGVVWYQDFGLRFMDWGGQLTKVAGVPIEYGRLAFDDDSAYFVKRGDLMKIAEGDLTPRFEADAAELAGFEANDTTVRASLAGLLADDDPVVRVRAPRGEKRVTSLYSTLRGNLPLPAHWTYLPGAVAVGRDTTWRYWIAYDTRTYQPLWSHIFMEDGGRLDLYPAMPIPGGRKVALAYNNREFVILDARTGVVEQRLRLPALSEVPWVLTPAAFEDEGHVVYGVYDGPPNPYEDPRDYEPAPEELTWPNVLVRCSLKGSCERVARVEPAKHSIHLGISYLFPQVDATG